MKPLNPFVVLFLHTLFFSEAVAQNFRKIQTQAQLTNYKYTNSVAVADYDQDNDLDIFAVVAQEGNSDGSNARSFLLRNDGDGTYSDATEESGINHAFDYSGVEQVPGIGHKMGASWGDYNNDGFPDLFLTSTRYNRLYRNNGGKSFTDVTDEVGFNHEDSCRSVGALWWDYNNDSYLDLFVSIWEDCSQNRLYRNNHGSSFTDVTAETNIGGDLSANSSWMSIPIDVNDDGWMDLYVINDYDEVNPLFINHGGTNFTDEASNYGLDKPLGEGMGVALGDINNNGSWDMYITNVFSSNLYVCDEDGTYTDQASDYKVTEAGWAWGTQFADIDHDTDEDLIVVNGFYGNATNFLYKNMYIEGDTSFVDITEEAGMDAASHTKGVVAFDYDNDGDLDILLSNLLDELHFYENTLIVTETAEDKNWIKVSLNGTYSNSDGIGARIELATGSDTLHRFHHGANCLSQSLLPEHFGMGDDTSASFLKIFWPSGHIDEYKNIPANSSIHATENEGFVAVIDGLTKIAGCTDPNSCNYDPPATLDDGSCVYLTHKEITGKTVTGNLREEVYSYPHVSGSTYHWQIVNGEIIGGQGTASVTVRWGIGTEGRISVTEFRECNSETVHLDITMSTAEIPEDKSIARLWNEALLHAIRNDYARPTIHARNLFHTSVAMYDAWAIFNTADNYLIGNKLHGFDSQFDGFETEVEKEAAEHMAISYAAYRLMSHRFSFSPHAEETLESFDELMKLLSYDINYVSTDYSNGDPAALGNFIAETLINYGYQDGARESSDYDNAHYLPLNEPLIPAASGNANMDDPNRWQPLKLAVFIDQAGNPRVGNTPDFLNPEWGKVAPFSLRENQATTFNRAGNEYRVFLDPGAPPYLDTLAPSAISDAYKWGFSLVSVWSAHLDPTDGVEWDISPKGIGNLSIYDMPEDILDFPQFYDLLDGGDGSPGRTINPITNSAYEPQIVPRGDYARVLAEFWADGPDSETPPGHWFVLLNYVNDHPSFTKRMAGRGQELSPLEWDVKAYFMLGGAMHDAAIAAWGIKGWYDYTRPISAIRYMAELGQSTDNTLDNYHVGGIPLIPDYIELVEEGDPLEGDENENVGKIKLFVWRGHDYIQDTDIDQAGVGWTLAADWWPYQRPSFVTPPFAGYVSGHSTYSRAAAEVMTLLTGSEYFPDGMGEFVAKKDEFLVFEQGPSQDVTLQWATYRDASDQCSLSRIWGGIHPPADDIPGRKIGEKIGIQAFEYATSFFGPVILKVDKIDLANNLRVFPNPLTANRVLKISSVSQVKSISLFNALGQPMHISKTTMQTDPWTTSLNLSHLSAGIYILKLDQKSFRIVVQ